MKSEKQLSALVKTQESSSIPYIPTQKKYKTDLDNSHRPHCTQKKKTKTPQK